MSTQTPWAILLCKFKDSDVEPYPRKRYEDLFTASGVGTFNMVDFFSEMSHGSIDLSGSQVFGWFTLDQNSSDYVGSGANQKGRDDLLAWARQKHRDNGVPVDSFYNVVVVMNVATDLFGGLAGVVCDDGRSPDNGMTNLSPSLLGQEMGHGYGMQHSQANGNPAPYMDRWDTMSTANALMTPDPTYPELDVRGNPIFLIGPGLNAANMSGRGWLDQSRIWSAAGEEYGASIQLRPLHRTDLPGYLAAQVGQFFIEFRVPQRWDAGIGQAVVLVHDYVADHSDLFAGDSGRQGLIAGDTFEIGDTSPGGIGPLTRIDVISINEQTLTATIGATVRPDRRPAPAGPSRLLFGAGDGVGIAVSPNGTIVQVEPHLPLIRVLDDVVALQSTESIASGVLRDQVRRQTLQSLRDKVNAELERLDGYRSPAPPAAQTTTSTDGAVEPGAVSVGD